MTVYSTMAIAVSTGSEVQSKVAASATSGIPFISQGTASSPVFGTATVPGGGTGAVTFTAHSILLGQGTSAITALGAATNGQLPIGSTGANPVLATLTQGTNITITNGAGTIQLDVSSGAGLSLAAFGSVPNANGLTLTAGVLNMQPADGTFPGGVSTTTQNFVGNKIFNTSATSASFLVLSGGGGLSTIQYPTSATSFNFNMPTTAGTSGFFLTSGGGGSTNMTWTDPSTVSGVLTITGNSGGAESPSAGNFNIVGTGSITTVGSAATETIQLTGLTNHNVLVGAGTATITNISPSTSGFVLTSNGVSSDPSFQSVSASGAIITITGNSGGAESPSVGNFNLLGGTTGLTFAGTAATETLTGTLVVANGGTGVTSVTTAPTATAFAGWNAQSNLSANSFLEGYATTATSAATTTLTVASAEQQYFTGSTTQTVLLPVTSTLVLGQKFIIVNNSSGVVTVQSSGAVTIQAMAAATQLIVTVILTSGTSAASWSAQYTSATALSSPLTVPNGGTGAVTLTGVLVGNGTSAFTGTTPVIDGVLISNHAAGVPSWLANGTAGFVLTAQSGAPPAWVANGNGSVTSVSVVSANGFAGTVATATTTPAITLTTTITGVLSGNGTAITGSTVTQNGVLVGGASNAVSSTAVGTTGQVLQGNTGAAPTWGSPAASSISLTGDSGGALTGASFTIRANTAGLNSGSSVSISGSGTTLTLNVTDANQNTLVGITSGNATLTSTNCTSIGERSMKALTSGAFNNAIGSQALTAATTAQKNFAAGYLSLGALVSGAENVCIGHSSGINYTGAESSNICIGGEVAGTLGESNVMRLGSGTGTGNGQLNKAFISGVTGIVVTGSAAIISTGDQLGVLASSRRFKDDIQDMNDSSSVIMKLRPVTFVWNKKSSPGLLNATDERQFGVIAEEAAEVIPSLVNYDEKGNPFSFKYGELPAVLLNELQKALKRIEALEAKLGL